MALPGYLRVESDALLLCVKVQPRSSVNEIGEPLGNELRVKVTAPPVDSAANEALLRLLARGRASRHKVIRLRGLDVATVMARLAAGS